MDLERETDACGADLGSLKHGAGMSSHSEERGPESGPLNQAEEIEDTPPHGRAMRGIYAKCEKSHRDLQSISIRIAPELQHRMLQIDSRLACIMQQSGRDSRRFNTTMKESMSSFFVVS
jgi:hypothetical protein